MKISARRDKPIDQVGPYLTSRLNEWSVGPSAALNEATEDLSHQDPLLHQHGSQPSANRLPHVVASCDMQGSAKDLFLSPRVPTGVNKWYCILRQSEKTLFAIVFNKTLKDWLIDWLIDWGFTPYRQYFSHWILGEFWMEPENLFFAFDWYLLDTLLYILSKEWTKTLFWSWFYKKVQ